MADIGARNVSAITDAILELADLGLVETATVEARAIGAPPVFKAYIVNEQDVFFGHYPVVEHDVRANGDKIRIYDPMGNDATLFHQADDGAPESIGSAFVAETRKRFDSVWTSTATEVHQ